VASLRENVLRIDGMNRGEITVGIGGMFEEIGGFRNWIFR